MFCHRSLRGKSALKPEPEVSLTSSRSRLSYSRQWPTGRRSRIRDFRWNSLVSGSRRFLFPPFFSRLSVSIMSRSRLKDKSPSLSVGQKWRSAIGRGRLVPLVKWYWHTEGWLEKVVIHHDSTMTQSSALLKAGGLGAVINAKRMLVFGSEKETEWCCWNKR